MKAKLFALLALTACDTDHPQAIVDQWKVHTQVGKLPLEAEIHIDDNLNTEVCVPVLGAQLRIATAIWERDAFDAYHLRIAAMDAGITSELPLPLLRALQAPKLALIGAVGNVEYALRFCAPAADHSLRCESLIGVQYATWHRAEGDSVSCESSFSCGLAPTPTQLELLDCVGNNDGGAIDAASPLCSIVEAPTEQITAAVNKCLVEKVAPGVNPLDIEAGCSALITLESSDAVPLANATCDTTANEQLCLAARKLVDAGGPEAARALCLEKSRLVSHALACCR